MLCWLLVSLAYFHVQGSNDMLAASLICMCACVLFMFKEAFVCRLLVGSILRERKGTVAA